MSKELLNLFSAQENKETANNARSLAGTAQLTSLASTIANEILKTINDNFEEYQELIAKSKSDHDAMDELIAKAFNLADADVEFLKQLDEVTLDGMLKSQQSKRSRAKSKVMTMDNYRSMMIGAIAENLIRLVTGKKKSAGGNRRSADKVYYSAEELAALQADQEKLRKEIRNVQSKKSIMKSKEGFSEEDKRWQALLVAEEQLKALRADTRTVVVDETKEKLTAMLNGVDVNNLKAADAKDLLAQALALINGKEEDVKHE
jgi:hypothetical protein